MYKIKKIDNVDSFTILQKGGVDIDTLIEALIEAKNKGANNVTAYIEWSDEDIVLDLDKETIETDEEYEKRIKNEEQAKESYKKIKEKQERELYEELKNKYEI